YQTVIETQDDNGAVARLLESGADWITFTSSSTVENFHARFDLPKLMHQFPNLKTLSIGPETSKTLSALGLTPTVEAATSTIEGMIASLLKAIR
ncbi:MAG: HemD protein, partial [Verrucomicrobia bacterium]